MVNAVVLCIVMPEKVSDSCFHLVGQSVLDWKIDLSGRAGRTFYATTTALSDPARIVFG